jgi:hypothetical protein
VTSSQQWPATTAGRPQEEDKHFIGRAPPVQSASEPQDLLQNVPWPEPMHQPLSQLAMFDA